MKCQECNKDVKEKVTCENCLALMRIQHMWEIERLERVKTLIDEIIKLSKLEEVKNPYTKNDWEGVV